jgi:biopolymer transport protein ExbD
MTTRAIALVVAVVACNDGREEIERQRAENAALKAELVEARQELKQHREADEREREARRSGIRIELPRGGTTEIDPSQSSLVIDVTSGGPLVVAGRPIAGDEIDKLFAAAYARDKQTQVVIRADRDAPYERVVDVMARAKRAGLARLAIATNPQ